MGKRKRKLDKKSIKALAKIQSYLDATISAPIPKGDGVSSAAGYRLSIERAESFCRHKDRECVFYKEGWTHCEFLRSTGTEHKCTNRVLDNRELGVDSGKLKYAEHPNDVNARILSRKECGSCEDILRKEDAERKRLEKERKKKKIIQTIELLSDITPVENPFKEQPKEEIRRLI